MRQNIRIIANKYFLLSLLNQQKALDYNFYSKEVSNYIKKNNIQISQVNVKHVMLILNLLTFTVKPYIQYFTTNVNNKEYDYIVSNNSIYQISRVMFSKDYNKKGVVGSNNYEILLSLMQDIKKTNYSQIFVQNNKVMHYNAKIITDYNIKITEPSNKAKLLTETTKHVQVTFSYQFAESLLSNYIIQTRQKEKAIQILNTLNKHSQVVSLVLMAMHDVDIDYNEMYECIYGIQPNSKMLYRFKQSLMKQEEELSKFGILLYDKYISKFMKYKDNITALSINND